ncbi:MAG: hypothetical protein ACOC83_06010 [Gemmatimonadota bacterium]
MQVNPRRVEQHLECPAGLLAACLLIPSLAACGADPAGESPATVDLTHVESSSRVPPSRVDDLALLSREEVCLVDSYRVRVLCGGRRWESPRTVGSAGEGPGQYRDPTALARGPDGTVGVLDGELGRLTLFEPDGSPDRSLRVPPGFRPVGPPHDDAWPGTYVSPGDSVWSAPVAWISLEHDSVLATRSFRHESEATGAAPAGGVPGGARAPDGTFAFWVGGDYALVRFGEDGEFLGTFSSPAHEPELPSDRDVEAFRDDMRELAGRAPPPARIREFREEPKLPLVPGDPLRYDSAGRLWAATTRDHEERSHFDLFRGGDYLGSVSVRDRLLAYDLFGSTLAVLVERAERDSAGLRPRHVEWYRIGE